MVDLQLLGVILTHYDPYDLFSKKMWAIVLVLHDGHHFYNSRTASMVAMAYFMEFVFICKALKFVRNAFYCQILPSLSVFG